MPTPEKPPVDGAQRETFFVQATRLGSGRTVELLAAEGVTRFRDIPEEVRNAFLQRMAKESEQ